MAIDTDLLRFKLRQLSGIDGDERQLIQFVLDFKNGLVSLDAVKPAAIVVKEAEKVELVARVAKLDAELVELKR